MNQKNNTSYPRILNTAWLKMMGVGAAALSISIVMFSCASPTPHTPLKRAEAAATFEPSDGIAPEVWTESTVLYHYLMGQVAGIHSGLAEQEGDSAKEAALIDVAIPNLVQANEYLNDAELAEQTAKTALFAKRYEDAQRSAARWIALKPMHSKPYQLAAIVEMRQHHYDKAAAYLNQVMGLEASPEQGEQTVLALLGTLNHAESVAKVADVLALQRPQSVMPALASARAYYKQKDYEAALPYLDQALTKDADSIEAVLLKTDVLTHAESAEAAIQFLETRVNAQPENAVLRGALAELLSDHQKLAQASEQYAYLLKHPAQDNVKKVPVLMRMAQLQLQQENAGKAIEYLNRVVAVQPKDERYDQVLPRVYYRLGMAHEMQEHWSQAMASYKKLQSVQYADAWLKDTTLVRMVIVDLQQKRFALAKQTLDQLGAAVKKWQAQDANNQPKPREEGDDPVKQLSVEWHQLRTEWFTRQDDHEGAYASINQGLDAHPDSFDLRYTRSLVAEQLGNTALAVSDLEHLLKQQPDSPDVKNALGYTLANQTQEYDRAYALIKEALDALPESYAVMDSMGWVLFKQGKLDEAEQHLRTAYEQSKDAEVSAHLFEVLWAQDKQTEATRVLKASLALHPNAPALKAIETRLMKQ